MNRFSKQMQEDMRKWWKLVSSGEFDMFSEKLILGDRQRGDKGMPQGYEKFTELKELLQLDEGTVEEIKRDLLAKNNDSDLRLLCVLENRSKQIELLKSMMSYYEVKTNDLRRVIEALKLKLIGITNSAFELTVLKPDSPAQNADKLAEKLNNFVNRIDAYQENETGENLNEIFKGFSKVLRSKLEENLEKINTKGASPKTKSVMVIEVAPYERAVRNFLERKAHSVNAYDRMNNSKKNTGMI